MDLDGRAGLERPTGNLWDAGDGCPRQHSRGAIRCGELDRCDGKFLALWREWSCLTRRLGKSQRSLEIQRGRMDLGEWVGRGQPEGNLRERGNAFARQRSRGPIRCRWLD